MTVKVVILPPWYVITYATGRECQFNSANVKGPPQARGVPEEVWINKPDAAQKTVSLSLTSCSLIILIKKTAVSRRRQAGRLLYFSCDSPEKGPDAFLVIFYDYNEISAQALCTCFLSTDGTDLHRLIKLPTLGKSAANGKIKPQSESQSWRRSRQPSP